MNRRGFVGMAGAASLLGGSLGPRGAGAALPRFSAGKMARPPAVARGRVLGANDRIHLAHVGLGGMGGPASHLRNFRRHADEWNVQSIGLCDVYAPRLARSHAFLEGEGAAGPVRAVADYRRLLDDRDVDGVVIATPEHWHCPIAAHALEAGKHVYVEKPLGRYLDEAFRVHDVARRTGKVVQVGVQACSDPKYHAAREAIAAGRLGPLVSVQCSYTRNGGRAGEWNGAMDADAGPQNLDWQTWLGSTPGRPWNEEARSRFFRYRRYRDYSAGVLGDLMPHRIHPVLMAAGGGAWPVRVQCLGTRNVATHCEVSDTVHVVAEMQGGWTFFFLGSIVNEQGVQEMARGSAASLYLAAGEPELRPERHMAEEVDGGKLEVGAGLPGDNQVRHERNWLDCIREGGRPHCDLDLAIRAQALISLAEISEVTGKTVRFDPARRRWSPA